jgi:DNA (cytosine-5)-methyltransferase 1
MTVTATKFSQQALPSIELFTGAGGLALGTHEAGFQHLGLLEWNADACSTLAANVREHTIPGIADWNILEGDVRSVRYRSFGDVALVAGGPPCQPFSIGGKHRGMKDERDMIPEFIRAVRELRPSAFIFENVKGLTRQTFRNYFSYIQLQMTYPTLARKTAETWIQHLARLEDVHTKGRFRGLHYNVVARLLNAANYGVPQTRERVFIVGFRSDLEVDWHFPDATHTQDRLLYDQWVTGDYWKRHRTKPSGSPRGQLASRVARLSAGDPPTTEPWVTVREAISDLPEPRASRESPRFLNHRLQPGAKAYVGHTGSALDWPSKTLKAGVHGVPGGENMIAYPNGRVRYYSVREAARIQTFPDNWHFFGSWSEVMRQLGNAVPMRLATIIATSVAERLRKAHEAGKAVQSA